MAKERHKVLRQEFGANKTDRRLLAEEYSRLKFRVNEVEGTMKETLFKPTWMRPSLPSWALRIRKNLPRIRWPYSDAKYFSYRLKLKGPEPPLPRLLSLRWSCRRQWHRVERYLLKARIQ